MEATIISAFLAITQPKVEPPSRPAVVIPAIPKVEKLKPVAEPSPRASFVPGNSIWDRLAQCESGGNWAANTGNGFYGGLQFNLSTWQSNGGSGYPHLNSREEQIRVAENLRSKRGFSPWPACSRKLGLT